MKGSSPYKFIVKIKDRYNNKVAIGDKELIVNTDISVKDYMYTNRVAEIVSIPTGIDTPIKVGDHIIVHHNTFRRWYDVRGNEKEADGFLEDDTYLVNYDEVFGYGQPGNWKAMPGYCFIKPVSPESIWNTLGESLLKGILIYYPEELRSLEGHVVGFTPESEYEFNIDGERIYRIYSHHITLDYGSETEKETDNTIKSDCVDSIR